MTTARAFRGVRCPAEIIRWAVRWSLQGPISDRHLQPRRGGRPHRLGRRVQRLAPEFEKRMRRHLRPCRGPGSVEETDGRVAGSRRARSRALDGPGQRIDVLLSAKRDKVAAPLPGVHSPARTPATRGWS